MPEVIEMPTQDERGRWEVPLHLYGPNVELLSAFVDVNLGQALRPGQKPPITGRFLIDTGSMHTVISTAMLLRLGMSCDSPGLTAFIGATTLSGAGGLVSMPLHGPIPVRIAGTDAVQHLRVGVLEFTVKKVPAHSRFSLDGVLGFDFLRHYKCAFDFGAASMDLERASAPALGAARVHPFDAELIAPFIAPIIGAIGAGIAGAQGGLASVFGFLLDL